MREDQESYVDYRSKGVELHTKETALQYTEVLETPYQKHLLIHRNGSSTVRTCLAEADSNSYPIKEGKDKLLWAVLRDPYDRFVDAVAYDIKYSGEVVSTNSLDDRIGTNTKIKNYVVDVSIEGVRDDGYLKHSMMQLSYLFDNNINVYVDIEDLDTFCSIHFPNTKRLVNASIKEDIIVVKEYFDSMPELKEYILETLTLDYFMISRLKHLGKKWNWYMGRIF